MTVSHGFELLREETIPELNTRARLWRHGRTGAQLLSLENDDENKVFGITFRTPPDDSTGLPHILEHVVLAGSEKYPLKAPFFEMVKGSLATFINAMTFPDKTVYPAASANLQDFYNLLDVYADAVFHPLLSPEKLAQEGWHYEMTAADAPLGFRGVVFNEMKGAYSSPDNLLDRLSRRALFPDNTYGFDSGGDPAAIPDLTYDQFRRFYQTYYHPSNALLYFYGDDDPDERLRRMDDYLRPFDRQTVDGAVARQAPFAAPRTERHPYAAAAGEAGDGPAPRAFVEVNWLLPEYDPALVMAFSVLSHALLDTPASPLRKALIDSGLGEDVLGGFSTFTRQMTFSAGLKGVPVADVDRVEPLILDTLAALARDGFDPEMVAAAVNTIEFRLRENNTGRAPRGLGLLMRALNAWLHGGDPLAPLAFEAPLAALKARLADDPAHLSSLIGRHLLDNPHRVAVILEPDAELTQRQEAAEQARLAAARAAMSPADVAAVVESTADLKRRQETPDPPEVVATLPALRRDDLEPRHKPIPLAVDELAGARVLTHDLFTNGIVYLDLALDLAALPADLLPYAPLFGRALLEMGTAAEDYVRLSQRIGRTTGGLNATTLIAPQRVTSDERSDELRVTSDEFRTHVTRNSSLVTYLVLRGKATLDKAPAMLDILRDVLLTVRLDNRERFRQMVLEAKAGAESQLVPAGHLYANVRLRAHFHPAFRAEDATDGLSQLLFLRRLAERVDGDWPGVLADLEATRAALVNRAGVIANVTLDEASYAAFEPGLAALLEALPNELQTADSRRPTAASGQLPTDHWPLATDPYQLPPAEGFSFPTQVNFVAKGANLYDLGYTRHGSIAVINNLLGADYLMHKIRVQGGAYGAFARFDGNAGVLTFLSYRDPNLAGTLQAYDGAAAFLRDVELSDAALTRAIVGAIGVMDTYLLPDAKGYTSLRRYLVHETDDFLQQLRDEALGTTIADFHALAEVLERVNEVGDVVVLGSAEALERAREEGVELAVMKVM